MMTDTPINILRGRHNFTPTAYGDWRISKDLLSLQLGKINHLLVEDKLKIIDFKDIAWKGMNLKLNMRRENCICSHGRRFDSCDTGFPGILTNFSINIPNPFNRKYRMLDGKHRLEKMLSQNITRSLFYVLDLNDIIPYTEKIKP